MTVHASIGTVDTANEGSRFMYFIKEFLKTLGWTVEGSGDGSNGGMDAVDRIANQDQFEAVLTNWLVIESPDNLCQLLFTKGGEANDLSFTIKFNPAADWTGGGSTTEPTSPSGVAATVYSDTAGIQTPARLHICGSDAAPFWWAVLGTAPGDVGNGQVSACCIPLENQPAGAGNKYWIFVGENNGFLVTDLDTQSVATNVSRGVAQAIPGDPPISAPANTYERDSVLVVPGGILLDSNQADLSFPVMFAANGPGRYFGTTTIMRWNGIGRPRLTTFNNRARICFGDVNFPWDGSTVPIV